MADLIQLRRDTLENWQKYNPILSEGELGLILDDNETKQFKIGDGVRAWNDLPYIGFNGNIFENLGNDKNGVISQFGMNKILRYIINSESSVEVKNGDWKSLDNITTPGIYVIMAGVIPSYYMFVNFDASFHQYNQWILGNLTIQDGIVDGSHIDGTTSIVHRCKNRSASSSSWSEWKYFQDSFLKNEKGDNNQYTITQKFFTEVVELIQSKIDNINLIISDSKLINPSDSVFNLNNYLDSGTYRIKGERLNSSDGLPINNAASGHSIDALLTVLNSSLNDSESCVTQIITISNRVGGDGDMYIRTAKGNILDIKDGKKWEHWQKLQTNAEVGQVTSLDSLIDNGIYSGVYTDGATFAETFVMITINNYSAATSFNQTRCVSQYKYSLNIDGSVTYKTRVGRGDNVDWGDWVDESKRISELEKDIELLGDDLVLAQLDLDKSKRLLGNMIPSFNGIVESATVQQSSTQSYNGVYFIKSSKLFAVKGTGFNGGYYSSWPGREVYNDITAIPNRCYYNTSDKEIYYFDGTSFTKIIEQEALLRKRADETLSQRISELESFVSSDYLEQTYAYGVEWDTAITTPECTRIGSMNLHRSLPVQSGMRGCLLNDNGVVVEYLLADDWTTAVRDGSKGQVMVELPKHYRKFVTNGTKRQVWLSMMPLAGYHEVPKAYVSAYEASIDRTNLKLASVVNTAEQYRGGDNTAEWDGTYRSLLGKPVGRLNFYNYREYARKRNANTKEWNMYVYNVHKTICWLFVVEYATLDTQTTFTSALTSEGYRQGGLGMGVTLINGTKLSVYNNSNPIIPCGYTDSLGNNTGVIPFSLPSEYDATPTSTEVIRYRGIENVYGHLLQKLDGLLIDSNSDIQKAYVCDNPELYDVITDNYRYAGEMPRPSEAYIRDIIFGEYGDILPSAVGDGADSHKYMCDVFTSDTYTRVRCASSVGGMTDSYRCGLFYLYAKYDFSLVGNSQGTRLCFIPNK